MCKWQLILQVLMSERIGDLCRQYHYRRSRDHSKRMPSIQKSKEFDSKKRESRLFGLRSENELTNTQIIPIISLRLLEELSVVCLVKFNRIQDTVAYMQSFKQQASLRARNLAQSHALLCMGHHFGKVIVLAIMSSKIYPKKIECTLNADQLKFNGQFSQTNISFIG